MRKIFITLLANLSLAGAATTSTPTLLQIPQDVMGAVPYFPTGDVQKMAVDPVHNVTYFLTAEGIVRYSPTTQTYTMGKDLGFDLNLPFIKINDITTDDQGDLYLLTPHGLYYSNDATHFKYFKAGCRESEACTNANIIASGQHVLINPSSQDFTYTIDLSDTDPEDSDVGYNGGLLGGTIYNGDLYLVQKHTIMNWSPDEDSPTDSAVYWNVNSPFFEFTGAISFTPHLDYITTAYNPRKGISMFCFATRGGKLNCDTTSATSPFTKMLTLPGKMYAFSDDQTVLFTNTGGSNWTTTTPDLNLQNLSILGVGPDQKIWIAGSTKDIAALTLQQAVELQPLKDLHPLALKARIPNEINNGMLSSDNQTLLVSAGYNNDLWLSTNQGASFTKIASNTNPAFMLEDANDSFLIDQDNNIFRINGMQPMQPAALATSAFPNVDSINVATIGNDTLYVATDDSILAAATNILPLQFKKIVSQPNVNNMAVVDGTLYFSDGNNLYDLDAQNRTETIPSDTSMNITTLHSFNNLLYLGTDHGLYSMDQKGTFTPLPATQNLDGIEDFFITNTAVYVIISDDDNSTQKLIMFTPQALSNPDATGKTILSNQNSIDLFGSGNNVYVTSDQGLFKIS